MEAPTPATSRRRLRSFHRLLYFYGGDGGRSGGERDGLAVGGRFEAELAFFSLLEG